MAVYSPAGSTVDTAIGSALESVRQECSGHDRRSEEKARTLRVSNWDEQAIAAEQSSRDEVVGFIKSIARTNAFARTWHSHVTAKGVDFLGELFGVVSGLPTSAELQFDPETIPFPSSWEFDLHLEKAL
ncbi:MAG TPA: hypothetical protein VGL97_12150 [Bryobacteraceae bacterium]|jgi:hypothetical protein